VTDDGPGGVLESASAPPGAAGILLTGQAPWLVPCWQVRAGPAGWERYGGRVILARPAASWSPASRWAIRGGDGDGSGPAATSESSRRQPAPPPATHMRSMSAGRLARSLRVAAHGLVQSAEGLLDAGVDLVRTLGAALACSLWLGRELGEPCSGLVGGWAGLVALGAVEAIIRVGMRGVGHGDHPGSRSGWAAKPAPRSEGNFQASAWAGCTLCLLAGRVNPASDVTLRWISPGIYGERGSAVAAGRLVSEADGD
jgi:hypothetical protein